MSDDGFDEAIRASQEYRHTLTRIVSLNNLIDFTQERKKEITTDTTMNPTMRDIELKRLASVEEELTRLREKQCEKAQGGDAVLTTPSLQIGTPIQW